MKNELFNKTFGMIMLGCDKNRVDGERLLGEILSRGCKITNDPQEAQILIVNTCAFLNEARKEAIDTILESDALRRGKLEKIVVSGCLPQKFIGELYPALTEADVFLGISDAKELFPALERAYQGERVNAVGIGGEAENLEPRLISTPAHYKYLKIAEGCSNHCTYCLIPKIRGKYVSYPLDELLKEARALGNTKELLLVAQDVSRYGEDRGENGLITLLSRLSALDNLEHIRLLYCYPEKITKELIECIKTHEKILPYLDIPMQHSEDRILKLMGRRGTRAQYLELVERLKEEIPNIAIRSTFISGFPSETEEEHEALKSFLREAKLSSCGFFAYSREKETPAYKMEGQIPERIKRRRVKELYKTQAEISRENLKRFEGKTLEVVLDGFDEEKGLFAGRTEFQAPEIDGAVYFSAPSATVGERYSVKIERTDEYDLYGTYEEENI